MPNDYLDQVQVGDTTYDLQDAAAQADLSQLKSQISAMGLSVVEGKLCVTFEEVA